MQVRQGDVLIEKVEEIPEDVEEVDEDSSVVLALGEATGHSHRIEDEEASQLSETGQRADQDPSGESFLVLENPSEVIHEEHDPIELPEGEYRVYIQREYTPDGARRIQD